MTILIQKHPLQNALGFSVDYFQDTNIVSDTMFGSSCIAAIALIQCLKQLLGKIN